MAMELIKPKLAPRPARKSYSRSVYDALVSLNGDATVQQIATMLPATDDADKWQTNKPERVMQVLKGAEQHGYVQQVGDRWRVARFEFYNARQEHHRKQAEARLNGEEVPKLADMIRAEAEGKEFRLQHLGAAFLIGWGVGALSILALFMIGGLIGVGQ